MEDVDFVSFRRCESVVSVATIRLGGGLYYIYFMHHRLWVLKCGWWVKCKCSRVSLFVSPICLSLTIYNSHTYLFFSYVTLFLPTSNVGTIMQLSLFLFSQLFSTPSFFKMLPLGSPIHPSSFSLSPSCRLHLQPDFLYLLSLWNIFVLV